MSNALIEDLIRRVIARFELIGYDASQLAYDLTGANAENARVKPFLSAIDAATPILGLGVAAHSARVRCIVRNALGKPVKAPTSIILSDAVAITGVAAQSESGCTIIHNLVVTDSGNVVWVLPSSTGIIDITATFASNPAEPNPIIIDTGMKRFVDSITIG